MSGTDIDDDDLVYDISTEGDRDGIVAEVIAHAALQEAQYRQPMSDPTPPGRWKAPLALVVIVLAALLAAFPPEWIAPQPETLSEADRVRGLRAALLLQAQQLEAFRVRNGRLPASLEETGLPIDGVRYVRSNNRVYQLVATGPTGANLVYDSAQPDSVFTEVGAAWAFEVEGS